MASPAAAMQREAVALAFMAVRLAAALRRCAGDEGGQTQLLILTADIRLRLAVILPVVVLAALVLPALVLAIVCRPWRLSRLSRFSRG